MSDRDKPEPSRVRAGGTVVTLPTSPEERIAALRAIVARGQYAKVDGVMVDLFSASAVVGIYDALSEANRAKYAALPAWKMAAIAFRLMKGQK
jgi:hypothetical protein